MKNLLNTKRVTVGVITSLATGLSWVAMLRRLENISLDDIRTGIVPLIVMLVIIGLSIGLVGKRNGSSLPRVFFSIVFGTGLSPFAIIPLMLIVVLPLGKLAEWLGLIDWSTMSSDAATTLTIISMLAIWLIVGIAAGIVLLFVTVKKPGQVDIQRHIAEHGSR